MDNDSSNSGSVVNLVNAVLSFPSETRTIEFKRLGGKHENARIAQSIVAMANTDGGTIVLGVDDPEKSKLKGLDRIFGIEEDLDAYDELGRVIQKVVPPLGSMWPGVVVQVPEKDVRIVLLAIPKAQDHFRFYENAVFVRLEKGNKRLSPQEIIDYAYAKGFERADKELVEVGVHLLDTPLYEGWRRKRGIPDGPIADVLEKTGLARRQEDVVRPTRAAVLLFADFPNDLMDTKCTIRVLRYEGRQESIGETLNLVGAPKTIHGPIIKQITEAQNYVLGLLSTGLKVASGFIVEYQIPERAIKEAITNAVIHRDYNTKVDIEVKIFEDRLEVESPGLLPFNITPANIGLVRASGYRNDLLVKHLREFPDPPNLDQSEGVRAMRTEMAHRELYPPVFLTYPQLERSVRVILLNEKAPDEWDKISDYLNSTKYINNAMAREILGVEDTVKVSKLFNRWVRQGLLTKIDSSAKQLVRYRLPSADERSLFTTDESKQN